MAHVNEQPMKVMNKAGFIELVGKEHFIQICCAKHAEDCIDSNSDLSHDPLRDLIRFHKCEPHLFNKGIRHLHTESFLQPLSS